MYWPAGENGKGALLTGDVVQVVADARYVRFMRSYPNLIPLSSRAVRQIQDRVEPFAFEKIYGAWWGRNVLTDRKNAIAISAERYLHAIAPH